MPRVTLRDVANAANVTAATVSRALDPSKQQLVSEATRRRIVEAARDLGYRGDAVARGLRKGRSGTLGIVVADLGNPFVAPVLRGIENGVESRNLMPLITESQDRHDRLVRVLDHLTDRRVDVAIVTAARRGDARVLTSFARSIPVVLALRSLTGGLFSSVTHDDLEGGRLAARHLIESGHRRVSQLRGPADISSFEARDAGFAGEVRAARAEEIVSVPAATDMTIAEGRRLMVEVLAGCSPPPTAVFAHNDLMAVGAIDALRGAGLRCPEDVGVMGYNDSPFSDRINPPLTTIRFPGYQVGRLAAGLALNLIDDREAPVAALTLRPTVIVRQSTVSLRPNPERPP